MSGLLQDADSSVMSLWPVSVRIPLQRETLAFVFFSVMDFCLTCSLLSNQEIIYTESNPLARYFLYSWGFFGLAVFKLTLMAIVETACQLIAQQRPVLGSRVLNLCTAIVGGVVVYSMALMLFTGN